MVASDIPAVAALERACFSQPWSERVLEGEMKNPNSIFFVAEETELVGYIGMQHILDEGYLANVAVDSAYRRSGVGTALLQRLLAFAQQEKLAFITLEVRQSNQPAIRFYQKYGFEVVGRRRNFYESPTEDALLMTKFL
ncbi:MAG: ribosomal protein S18-alanine N-acetyltransferase [Anaerotruncus sp.]|nr:ribosomal protein S18-alanine N-acetyltransferase [Anaerotruncus sp.]